MNVVFYALVIFMTLGVTLSHTLLQRIGIEPDYLMVALGAIVVTGLLVYRGLLLIMLVLLMSITINLPEGWLQQYSIDRDVLIVLQLMMVLFPIGIKGVNRARFT